MNWDRLAGEIDVTNYLPDRGLGRLTDSAIKADTLKQVALTDAAAQIVGADTIARSALLRAGLSQQPGSGNENRFAGMALPLTALAQNIFGGNGGSEPFGYDEVVEGTLPENPLDSFGGLDNIEGPILDMTNPNFNYDEQLNILRGL
tara:strand:+ start:560 stop:1000 length:441 start_codon:yes stop_codon:yes gene_type:complete